MAAVNREGLPDEERGPGRGRASETEPGKKDRSTDARSAGASQVNADRPALDDLKKEINARFELADKCQSKAADHRIAAGIALNQAHELVLSEGKQKGAWGKWLADNDKRDRSDCYNCMRIPAAPAP